MVRIFGVHSLTTLLLMLALSQPTWNLMGEDSARILPNLVVIFSDDQGMADVGCYGSEIPTPALDQLAREGMRFTQFYAASSICTPSRYGLFTGRYAHRSVDQLTGALMFLAEEDLDRGIRSGETTYVERLGQLGYHTSLVGKWHLGHGRKIFWPTKHGFDSFFGHTGGCIDFFRLDYGNQPDWYRGEHLDRPAGYATDVITDEAIEQLESCSASGQPFYLHLSYNAPHFGKGWDAAKNRTENVMQPKASDLERVRGISDPLRKAFAAKVIGMDEGIGRVLSKIDQLGLRENTLVVFMTDHGGDPDFGGSNLPYRGSKATLYEGGLRVPCIVRWPGRVRAASVSNEVACAVDWFATFGAMMGYPVNATDGVDLSPVLFDAVATQRFAERTLVWKTGAHQELGRKSWQAVRKGPWKWVKPPEKKAALFNLETDPFETKDLSSQEFKKAAQLAALAEES